MTPARDAGPAQRAAHAPWWAYASLAASMTLVGSYVGLSKLLVAVFPVFLLAWLRFAIAAVAMFGWLGRGPADAPLDRHDRRLLFWESFLGNFLFSICMLFGIALTSAVAAGVIMAAIPAAVALLSRLFLGERIARRVAFGIACAIAGIALLALTRHPDAASAQAAAASATTGASRWLGNALLLGAVLCEASYVVIGKRLTARVSARRISAIVNLWGLALVTPFGAWAALSFDFPAVKPAMWGLLLFYALAASMVTVWLWMTGLKHVPAASAGVYSVMLPVSAAAVGVFVLGEPFGSAHAIAFALAIAGVVLATGRDAAPPP
jgi:drug/metabolite transporter (DMT)-like permease